MECLQVGSCGLPAHKALFAKEGDEAYAHGRVRLMSISAFDDFAHSQTLKDATFRTGVITNDFGS